MRERDKLMRRIQAYSFAMHDTALYLDTHPEDRIAIEYYKKYGKLRKEVQERYNEKYGPLSADDYNEHMKTWQWVKTPWPWEKED